MTTVSHTEISQSSYVTEVILESNSTSAAVLGVVMMRGCLVTNFSAMPVPDDSKDLLSWQALNVMNSVKSCIIIPIFFFIGFPTNVLNLIVFFKHSLKQRINLCLFSLSLVDLIYLTFAFLMYADQIVPHNFNALVKPEGVLVEFIIKNHLLGCLGFSWASWFISAVVALERCFCVLFPLKSRTLLKTRTTGVILLVAVVVITGGRFAVMEKFKSVCFVDVTTGLKKQGLAHSHYYLSNKKLVDVLDGVVYGLAVPLNMCVLVTLSTAITGIALKKSLKFRKESSSFLSPREVALTKMLIYLSVQFIIFLMPNILLRLSLLFLPELNSSGNWPNLYFFMVGVVEVCAAANSSVNFFVYYCFGTKYRHTLHAMLCRLTARATQNDVSGTATNLPAITTISRAESNQK